MRLCRSDTGPDGLDDVPGSYLETALSEIEGVQFEMRVMESSECAQAGLRFSYLALVSENGRELFAFTSTDLAESDWSPVRAFSEVPCLIGPNGVLVDSDLLRRVKRVVRASKTATEKPLGARNHN
ncbi:MAG: hypothetical protein C0518_12935 [Opitutus sp.]|nr:hypothetical protein [Opitutus sp.]